MEEPYHLPLNCQEFWFTWLLLVCFISHVGSWADFIHTKTKPLVWLHCKNLSLTSRSCPRTNVHCPALNGMKQRNFVLPLEPNSVNGEVYCSKVFRANAAGHGLPSGQWVWDGSGSFHSCTVRELNPVLCWIMVCVCIQMFQRWYSEVKKNNNLNPRLPGFGNCLSPNAVNVIYWCWPDQWMRFNLFRGQKDHFVD